VGVALSLLVPYVAYIPADELTGSGVLGAVAAGLYMGARADEVSTASGRLQVAGFWNLLVFLVNAILFLLVGLQLPHVLDGVHGAGTAQLAGEALAITATVVAVRMGWMFVPRVVVAALRRGAGTDDAREATSAREVRPARLVLGWSTMRGAVSLAIAVGIPLTVSPDTPFPDRSRVIFLSYVAVLLLLVVPAVTLEPLVRRLGLQQGATQQRQLARARADVLRAVLERLDNLDLPPDVADQARGAYQARLARVDAWLEPGNGAVERRAAVARLRSELIDAQRATLHRLEAQAAYPASVLRQLRRDLDLEEMRGR
jgi:CPA1 family monovalent cation:H+ antiporter